MAVDIALRDLPDSLVQQLRERAERHYRSLEAEIVALLEEVLPARGCSRERIEQALSVLGTLEDEVAERLEESVREIRRPGPFLS